MNTNTPKEPAQPVILYDGVCNLCNAFVRFAARRDTQHHLAFETLDSPKGREVLASLETNPHHCDTVVLQEGENVYTESSAVLEIARRLGGAWRLLSLLLIVPRPLRDAAYRFVARHRYRLFGRRNSAA